MNKNETPKFTFRTQVIGEWNEPMHVYLKQSSWNDYGYYTLYRIVICDAKGIKYDLGHVKIASSEEKPQEDPKKLPETFLALGENFFSLGMGVEYYANLQKLDKDIKELFLRSINDIAFNDKLLEKALKEKVTHVSFLRNTSVTTIKYQYQRIINGLAILTPYDFVYRILQSNINAGYEISFQVNPESVIPTNIHVLIGSNGVGKTYLLQNMVKSFTESKDTEGEFIFPDQNSPFSRVGTVSHSIFDEFIDPSEEKKSEENYFYIGSKSDNGSIKDSSSLAKEFALSVEHCFYIGKSAQLKKSIEILYSDTLFRDSEVLNYIDNLKDPRRLKDPSVFTIDTTYLENAFKKLSSGHSIILLTIVKLVEKIEEKTLVLLDEPETHLHPPLLSAFIRCLSSLLSDINAVAIIATHSPVIVQEVPKSCVWKLSRFGSTMKVERFEIETFGESIGSLTRDIFGLEVTKSGFYELMRKAVEPGQTYEMVVEKYGNQLGFEARLLLRALFAEQQKEERDEVSF